MRRLLRSLATVITTQPFYAEEIQVFHMALDMVRHRLPILDRFLLE